MKYWTGYLTAAILGAIAWALGQMASKFTALVDMIYPYVTRTLQSILAEWSGTVDFCLWQMVVVVFAVVVIASVVLMLVLRWNPVRWLGWVLAVCSVVYLLNTAVWGLNYYAGPIAEDIRMEQREYTVEELADATAYYRDKANELAVQVKRDTAGNLVYDDFKSLANQAGNGFTNLVYDYSFPIFAGSTLPVKELGWADLYTSMGITGVTVGITGEAAVNPNIPVVSIPFTMCHEMAHRMSIATEGDANFAAFLAAMANEDVQFQYSAYFMAYRYCISALNRAGTVDASGAAARVAAEVGAQLQQDLDAYNDFYNEAQDETATRIANTANDTYLKTSGDTSGVASYGEVCDLLVNWHYQQVILPQIVEEVDPFDPFDESKVDLSGNANAKEQEPEDPNYGGVG